MTLCSVIGCGCNAATKGFCNKHYQRIKKRGSPDDYAGCHGLIHICTEDGCGRKVEAHGLCDKHYQRFKKYGSPADDNRTHAPIETRFWRYVEKSDGCWTWTGKKTKAGYGQIQRGGYRSGNVLVHRFSYQMHKGEIPSGLVVMHLCNNPSCVNPAHLEAGTYSENTRYAVSNGRWASVPPHKFGESHGASKLKESDVLLIRDSKESSPILSSRYGVSRSTINRIKQRITWSHLP